MNQDIIIKKDRLSALRIVVVYAALGAVWIFLSDVHSLSPALGKTDVVLDFIFVAATFVILYCLISASFNKRRLLEEELWMSEQRLKLALAASSLGVWEWDVQSKLLFWSSECFDILGAKRLDATLECFIDLLHPDDADHVMLAAEKALAENTSYSMEYRIIRSDGQLRWLSGLARPICNEKGVPQRLIGTVQDITERKLLEQSLLDAKEKLEIRIAERTSELEQANSMLKFQIAERMLVEDSLLQSEETALMRLLEIEEIYQNVPVGLCVMDTELRWLRINDRLAQINGFPADAHIGKRMHDLLPELAPLVEARMRRVLETGQPEIGIEIAGETAAQPGVQRTWRESWLPVKDATGQVIALSAVVEEITEYKRAHEELRRHRNHLDWLVKERTKELELRNVQLDAEVERRKLNEESIRSYAQRLVVLEEEMRKQLAVELHDEIGQDLTALVLNFTIISNALSQDARERLGERIDDSLYMFEEMGRAVRSMMIRLRPPVLDDFGLVAALNSLSIQFSRRNGITVDSQIDDTEPRLSGVVKTAFFRVAQEALNNVKKHAEASRVTLKLVTAKDWVRLSICDDGRGYDPYLKKSSDARVGWGLRIMRERAESVGALFRLDSKPGRGTVVSVEIGEDR